MQDTTNNSISHKTNGYIDPEFIDSLIEDSDLVSVIGKFVELKKEGANYKGLSPFSNEKTPSFMVSPTKQLWKDFSSGIGGNNALKFLTAKGFDYKESIEFLARELGREIQYSDNETSKKLQEKLSYENPIKQVLNGVIEQYHKQLVELPEDHPAKLEMKRRGYDSEDILTYKIGFAPGNNFTYNFLKETGNVEHGKQASLLNEKNQDYFFNRIIYPRFDKNGELRAIDARDLSSNPKIKWLKSKKNKNFELESAEWYGIHIAKLTMRQTKKVYIVEGCNDVIAFQKHHVLNTIGGNGTNLTIEQIKSLKKQVDTVVLCFDGDGPGQKAIIKLIPNFLENGFTVMAMKLNGVDPDEFCRNHWPEIEEYYKTKIAQSTDEKERLKWENALQLKDISFYLQFEINEIDGFEMLLEQLDEISDIEKANRATEICEVIAKIKNPALHDVYLTKLKKRSGIPISTLREILKTKIEQQVTLNSKPQNAHGDYQLPNSIEMTEEIKDNIKSYQLFQAKNRIWSQSKTDPPYTFRPVSNFEIKIMQHIKDERYPIKLINIENIFNENYVFDAPSDVLNKEDKFTKAVGDYGNFRWTGGKIDLQRLQAQLYDKMDSGRCITMLGWQPEGFYLFNNLVVVPGEEPIKIDKNGCFRHKEVSYYVPSANSVYKNVLNKYSLQKKFKHIPTGTITPSELFSKLLRVHGKPVISGVLFVVATLFRDYIVNEFRCFPLNFIEGPPGTGKDQLNACFLSFWGIAKQGTNIEAGNNTVTAAIRELAQFNNSMVYWSEYVNGNSKIDGTLKDLYDLGGKKGGNLDSRLGIDEILPVSSVSLSSNYAPINEALMTRLIWNVNEKQSFTAEELEAYTELNELMKKGFTHITIQILNQRQKFEEYFLKEYKLWSNIYRERIENNHERLLQNISILSACYSILIDSIDFSFSQNEMVQYFIEITKAQLRKLTTSGIVSKWWDCFIASMRGFDNDIIKSGRDLKVEGNELYFQFSFCYNQVQKRWYTQYREVIPSKTTIKEALKKDGAYLRSENAISFGPGRSANRSSADVVSLDKMNEEISDLIKAEIIRQEIDLGHSEYNNDQKDSLPY